MFRSLDQFAWKRIYHACVTAQVSATLTISHLTNIIIFFKKSYTCTLNIIPPIGMEPRVGQLGLEPNMCSKKITGKNRNFFC